MPAPKLDLSVHLGHDSGQSTLADINLRNYIGTQEVHPSSSRSTKSNKKLNSIINKQKMACCVLSDIMSIQEEKKRLSNIWRKATMRTSLKTLEVHCSSSLVRSKMRECRVSCILNLELFALNIVFLWMSSWSRSQQSSKI